MYEIEFSIKGEWFCRLYYNLAEFYRELRELEYQAKCMARDIQIKKVDEITA